MRRYWRSSVIQVVPPKVSAACNALISFSCIDTSHIARLLATWGLYILPLLSLLVAVQWLRQQFRQHASSDDGQDDNYRPL